jgi:Flp pilus assembly protein TadG
MRRSSPPRRGVPGCRRGTAAVEAALLLPLVLLFILGLWEVGRMTEVTETLSNAAREGGRAASTNMNNYAQVKAVVVDYLTSAGITNQANLRVDVVNLTTGNKGPGTDGSVGGVVLSDYDPTQASQLDLIQVTVTLPFDNVRWNTPRLISSAATQLTGQAVWPCAKDQVYPSSVTPPAGF